MNDSIKVRLNWWLLVNTKAKYVNFTRVQRTLYNSRPLQGKWGCQRIIHFRLSYNYSNTSSFVPVCLSNECTLSRALFFTESDKRWRKLHIIIIALLFLQFLLRHHSSITESFLNDLTKSYDHRQLSGWLYD